MSLGCSESCSAPPLFGVPQGFILVPLLFLIAFDAPAKTCYAKTAMRMTVKTMSCRAKSRLSPYGHFCPVERKSKPGWAVKCFKK